VFEFAVVIFEASAGVSTTVYEPAHIGGGHLKEIVRGRQYPDVRGKVVDWVEHEFEEGTLYIHVRFQDRTELTYTLGCRLFIEEAVLGDLSTGNFKTIREFVFNEQG
jgi:hypothetical protein